MEHVQCFEQLEACGYFDSIYLVNFLRFFFVFIYISLLYRTIFACVFSVGCYDNRYPYRSVSSAQPVTIWTFNQSDTKRNVLVHVTFTKEKARKNYFEESIKRKWSEKSKKKKLNEIRLDRYNVYRVNVLFLIETLIYLLPALCIFTMIFERTLRYASLSAAVVCLLLIYSQI